MEKQARSEVLLQHVNFILDMGRASKGADIVDSDVCAEKVSKCVKGKDLKVEEINFVTAGEFLAQLNKNLGRGDNEKVKVAELKRVEQRRRMMKEFVQKFKKVSSSRYEERALIEKFKRGMNKIIRRKLMEVKMPPRNY